MLKMSNYTYLYLGISRVYKDIRNIFKMRKIFLIYLLPCSVGVFLASISLIDILDAAFLVYSNQAVLLIFAELLLLGLVP